MHWSAPFGVVLIGLAFSQQPLINAVVARTTGSAVSAAAVSVSITLVCLLLLLMFAGGTLRPGVVSSLPWWAFLGGVIGVLVVAGSVLLVPMTGAALFVVCLVAGQLIGSSIADHVGAFGLTERALSPGRVIGLVLVLVGAALVQRH